MYIGYWHYTENGHKLRFYSLSCFGEKVGGRAELIDLAPSSQPSPPKLVEKGYFENLKFETLISIGMPDRLVSAIWSVLLSGLYIGMFFCRACKKRYFCTRRISKWLMILQKYSPDRYASGGKKHVRNSACQKSRIWFLLIQTSSYRPEQEKCSVIFSLNQE